MTTNDTNRVNDSGTAPRLTGAQQPTDGGSFESHLRCALSHLELACEKAPDKFLADRLEVMAEDCEEIYRLEAGALPGTPEAPRERSSSGGAEADQ